ncbi:DNA-processing protein DprA [Herbidospora cretacea]|uniref:DNA-processing protein DprA n=1 Tax=Herbidospora cretacea TaxID=28444 RepID=UPI000773793C|nr:DNA-processing protein DprA [Herbidospora cretacea]
MPGWDDSERAALVALLRLNPGERSHHDLVQRLTEEPSALALLRERLPADLFGDPFDDALESARLEVEAWETAGVHVLTMGEERYPHCLRDAFDRPALLFAQGQVVPADQGVAVVGSREVSDFGRRVAADIATALAHRGLTVVSGLAAGVDTTAHTSALRAGGRTVAVIGTGVDRYYPPENAALQREIATKGAVFSQFWPGQGASKTSFPIRNGTMSGYALATVIVEAGERSGTRIQARKAVEHGRPVVLMRGVATHTTWGREIAARPDVHVVSSAQEAMSVIDAVADRPNQLDALMRRAMNG